MPDKKDLEINIAAYVGFLPSYFFFLELSFVLGLGKF